MKRLCFLIIIGILFPVNSSAQTYNHFYNSNTVIRKYCKAQWTNDYQMQLYCVNKQKEAVRKLKKGIPSGFPYHVFGKIRSKCGQEWREDYEMREYCEKQQMKAYRSLRGLP